MEARIGPFPKLMVENCAERKTYFNSQNRCRVESLSRDSARHVRKTHRLAELVSHEHHRDGFFDLLLGLLQLDPSERASAYDALQWPWNKTKNAGRKAADDE